MSEIVAEQGIDVENIYKLSERHTWGLDFYNREPVKILKPAEIKQNSGIWLYATDKEVDMLRMQGFDWDRQYSVYQFRITRLQGKFLNPKTRPSVINQMHLIYLY